MNYLVDKGLGKRLFFSPREDYLHSTGRMGIIFLGFAWNGGKSVDRFENKISYHHSKNIAKAKRIFLKKR
ncbi:MAG: hypothetical protein D6805_04565 [Planctomycetota bacterium]|nr:MAG: hypothetical protein D6805_04565 [Planctomycetota bacterium]